MNRMVGFIAGSILGATLGMYAVTRTSPRGRKRLLKRGKKLVSKVGHMNIL